MEKKSKIVLGVIVILIIISAAFLLYSENKHVQLGKAQFDLPSGFSANKIDDNHINISNNDVSLRISEYKNKNITIKDAVNHYIKTKENESSKCNITKFNVNDTEVYKTTIINNTNILHFWFEKNGTVYEIATYDGNSNTDSRVTEIINSMKLN